MKPHGSTEVADGPPVVQIHIEAISVSGVPPIRLIKQLDGQGSGSTAYGLSFGVGEALASLDDVHAQPLYHGQMMPKESRHCKCTGHHAR